MVRRQTQSSSFESAKISVHLRPEKGFSHREGAKDAKSFKDEVQDFQSFSKRFAFPSCIINFLRVLRFFAVKRFVFPVDSSIELVEIF